MLGRIAAGILVLAGLLAPGSLHAQEASGAAAPPPGGSVEERLQALERAQEADDEATLERLRLEQRIEELQSEQAASDAAAAEERERLERRVEELETAKVANEDATRSIIAESLAEWGSKINEFVDFGGVIEVLPAWEGDFRGEDEQAIKINTVELQFDVEATEWARGNLVVEYDNGEDLVFTTTEDDEFSIDRINVDTAFATVGNTERFPAYASLGRMIVPFGISTGDPVADVLTIVDPLTVEVFEMREDAILVGFEFPTPARTPERLAEAPPPVRPLVVEPILAGAARRLGFRPDPTPPRKPELVAVPPPRPPFSAGVYFYDGDTFDKNSREGEWDLRHQMGAFLGYHGRVACRPFLGGDHAADGVSFLHAVCPMAFDLNVELNRSVYDTDFLALEYRSFLRQIGFVPGMAASLKTNLGPLGLVGEWNGAIQQAEFLDDSFTRVSMRPRAWQVSLGYQFDWNAAVEEIGAQGTYLAFSYSVSRDLGGVTRFNPNEGTLTRVGFAPQRRLAVGVGEWVLPQVRIALEYARSWDYPKDENGSGVVANGVFSMLTFEW